MDVLVAHRDPELRSRVARLLQEAGHLVGEVEAPEAAPSACREHDPDVVLLQADRLDALHEIKADIEEYTVAVVLVGTEDEVGDPATLLEQGAHDVLLEPLREPEVLPRVAGAIKVRHLQEAVLDVNATVEAVSHLDAVTGVYNRRFVFEQFVALTNSALRHRRSLTVVAVDVDQIREIDERHGFLAGDEVMRTIADRMSSRLREEDVLGRVERSDFLALLPDTPGVDAARVAEGLRDAAAGAPVLLDGRFQRITVSVGWAELDPRRSDDFLGEVQAALHRARHGGRNRVCGPLMVVE